MRAHHKFCTLGCLATLFCLVSTSEAAPAGQRLSGRSNPLARTALSAEAEPRRYPDPIVPFETADAPEPAPTETLADAIALAYRTNPTLGAGRYELRATDENLAQALSELRPTTQVQVSGGYDYTNPGRITQAARPLNDRLNHPNIERNDLSAQFIVDQPLYTGGRATADIAAAGQDIRAGREALRSTEGDLLVGVITAYVDVRRDAKALAIRRKNVDVLLATLGEVTARREAGELTRTDIAQAQTQLQSARVQLNAAEAQLEQSRSVYTGLVGLNPGILAAEPPLPLLPGSTDAAFEIAEASNPELAQAVYTERASRARIAAARSEARPTLSLRGTAGASGQAIPFHDYNQDKALTGRAVLTIPLTSGGRTGSLIAQASDRNSADRLRIEAARRQMVQNIVSAWNQMVTSDRNEGVQRVQLDAARVFYEGTFEEYRAGLRSTFDVLYAQNSLRDTEISLLASKRDLYVAQANLLRQLGRLEVGSLLTGTGLYEPSAHVREVERRGAMPWDAGIRIIDRTLAPSQAQQSIEQPARLPDTPRIAPAGPTITGQPLITASPITPAPGTSGRPVSPERPEP